MVKYFFSFFIILWLSGGENITKGEFNCSNGLFYYKLVLNEDNTFEQQNQSCNWGFRATGKWTSELDTIKLNANRIYTFRSKGKMKLVKDSLNSREYNFCKKYLNQYLIVNSDTIIQLSKSLEGNRYRVATLKRKE